MSNGPIPFSYYSAIFSALAVSVPHSDILCVAQALESQGFKGVQSNNGFERRWTCETCCVTLNHGKKFQAIWVSNSHTQENTHKIKAGQFLGKDNNIKDEEPKGEEGHVNPSTVNLA